MAIYFILAADLGAVKIGYAADPWSRLGKLRTDCPCEVKLVATLEGDEAAERELHARFDRQRMRGEWFAYAGEVESFVASLKPVEAKEKREAVLGPLSEKSGMSKSYLSMILSGKRKAPVAAMLHLFKTAGWKHPALDGQDEEVLLSLADKVPWKGLGGALK